MRRAGNAWVLPGLKPGVSRRASRNNLLRKFLNRIKSERNLSETFRQDQEVRTSPSGRSVRGGHPALDDRARELGGVLGGHPAEAVGGHGGDDGEELPGQVRAAGRRVVVGDRKSV